MTGRRSLGLGMVFAIVAALGASSSLSAVAETPVVIAAAGDIACPPPATERSLKCHQDRTAAQLAAGGYAAVLALGDEQYPCGRLSDFQQTYDRTWGALKSTTFPIPGDNEYLGNSGCTSGPGADGYFTYFGDLATPREPGCRSSCDGYYSFNLPDAPAWHVVALNSECTASGVGGCSATSEQYKWLKADLAANPRACTVAYMHKPYWGNATVRSKTKALVQLLYDNGVELLLSGHDHLYARFAPQTPASASTTSGLRQFVVGTGGYSLGTLKPSLPNTQFKTNTTFGLLELTLRSDGYDWAFRADSKASDGSYKTVDSGSDSCH